MKKSLLIICFLILQLITSGNSIAPVRQSIPDTDQDDIYDILLTPDDLLPICEWEQRTILTQRKAQGLLITTTLACGENPYFKTVDQNILITGHEILPGEANYFFSMSDKKDIDLPADVEDWSQSVRMPDTQWGIVFTKANVIAYIGVNASYTSDGKYYYDDVISLANSMADKIPEDRLQPGLFSTYAHENIDEVFVSLFFVSKPAFRLESSEGDLQKLRITNNLGVISFSAQANEPQAIRVELCRQNDEFCIMRWDLPEAKAHSLQLQDLDRMGLRSICFVNHYYDYFLNEEGEYEFLVSTNNQLVYRESIKVGK